MFKAYSTVSYFFSFTRFPSVRYFTSTSRILASVHRLFLLIPFLLGGAGGGDLKMLMAAGCLCGLRRVPLLLFSTAAAGFVMAVVMLLAGKADASRLKHWARCIFDWRYDRKAGRENLPPKSDEKVRLPFGVAIAIGTWLTLGLELWTRMTAS